jgi:hypothetical protein
VVHTGAISYPITNPRSSPKYVGNKSWCVIMIFDLASNRFRRTGTGRHGTLSLTSKTPSGAFHSCPCSSLKGLSGFRTSVFPLRLETNETKDESKRFWQHNFRLYASIFFRVANELSRELFSPSQEKKRNYSTVFQLISISTDVAFLWSKHSEIPNGSAVWHTYISLKVLLE